MECRPDVYDRDQALGRALAEGASARGPSGERHTGALPGRLWPALAVAAALTAAAAGTTPGTAAPDSPFSPGRSSFSLVVDGLEVPYRTFFVSALPGGSVEIRVSDSDADATYEASVVGEPATGGRIRRAEGSAWTWTAPARPGTDRLVIRRLSGPDGAADSVVLQAFTLVPAARLSGGTLAGYRMGTYPTPAYRGLDQYRPPEGFVQLTRENASLPVSPHFTLGQFPVKRPHRWPKFLPLGPRLVLKLELLLEEVNRRGIEAHTFTVMSAYRSPWYNTKLLDRPRYSRHIYGDAADVFVDADGNGYMDDLNGDGRISAGDAEVLYRIVEEMDRAAGTRELRGGLWKYRRTSNHPPFVHVDTRQFIAR